MRNGIGTGLPEIKPVVRQVEVTAVVRVHFDLDEKLATWLKALMQNPIYEDESSEERRNREVVFTAILMTRKITPYESDYVLVDEDIPF